MFFDECSAQEKSNSPDQYVFRPDFEAFRHDSVNLKNHGKDISQIVFGALSGLVVNQS
jgi:hypothetical protein